MKIIFNLLTLKLCKLNIKDVILTWNYCKR